MSSTRVYLMALSALMLVCFCAGANLRLKRSASVNDSNLDANGLCITAKNWKDDCNNCWCVANGAPACTLRGCIAAPSIIIAPIEPHQRAADVEKKCVPGSKWTDECHNSCWCSDYSVSVCTKIGCSQK